MPRATFFMPFLCHNFSQIFELSNFFQNLTRKVFKKLVFYLINSKLTKSRTFESNTAPPHISNFPRTQGFKSRTNWRYPAHSGNSGSAYLFVYFFHQFQQKSAWPVSRFKNIAKFWHFKKIIGPYKIILSYLQKLGQLAL